MPVKFLYLQTGTMKARKYIDIIQATVFLGMVVLSLFMSPPNLKMIFIVGYSSIAILSIGQILIGFKNSLVVVRHILIESFCLMVICQLLSWQLAHQFFYIGLVSLFLFWTVSFIMIVQGRSKITALLSEWFPMIITYMLISFGLNHAYFNSIIAFFQP